MLKYESTASLLNTVFGKDSFGELAVHIDSGKAISNATRIPNVSTEVIGKMLAVQEVARRMESKRIYHPILDSSEKVYDRMRHIGQFAQEHFFALYVDTKNN